MEETMRRAIRLLACSGLVGLAVCFGCSSSNDPASAGAGGAGQDSGSNGPCSSKPAADPAPDLTGLWAWKTVGSLLQPKTALTPEFRTRTVSTLLVQQTQTGTDLSVTAQYCSQYNEEDPGAPTHVTIPVAYEKTLAPFTRTGAYVAPGDGGAASLFMPEFAQVQGAHLADPANGALPTTAADPQVFDQDGDGNPGVTIKLGGLVSGDLYVVQRQKTDLSGVATSADRVAGLYGFMSEQVILGASSAFLQSAASSQKALPDPNASASTFVMVRFSAGALEAGSVTCDDVRACAVTLFQ
jgi:hypothetical protein